MTIFGWRANVGKIETKVKVGDCSLRQKKFRHSFENGPKAGVVLDKEKFGSDLNWT